jgi:hypothetical protein
MIPAEIDVYIGVACQDYDSQAGRAPDECHPPKIHGMDRVFFHGTGCLASR